MQAFLLAAGLGTRLRPFTDCRPKALVEVQGKPLLEIALDNLVRHGASRIVVNIHHFGNMVKEFICQRDWGTEVLISDERDLLLDTGGGLKKAAPLFVKDQPILIHNVDILSHIDLSLLVRHHVDSMNFATLATSQRDTSRQLLFNEQQQLVGWENRSSGEYRWTQGVVENCRAMAFSGIAVVNPHFLDLLPPADVPYAIIPAYLDIAKTHRISYFEHYKEDWLDVGKVETLKQAQVWKLS